MSVTYANIIAAIFTVILIVICVSLIYSAEQEQKKPCYCIVHVNSSHGTWVDYSHYIPDRCRVDVYDDYQSPNMTKSILIWGGSP